MIERMRSMLFCPANQPKMYVNAPVFKPDCILFDLEDSVAYSEKDSARELLLQALKSLNFGATRVCVRINSVRTEFWKEDIQAIVEAGAQFIRLSTCESAEDVEMTDDYLTKIEKKYNQEQGRVKIQCSLETAKGVLNARESINSSDRVISLSFGAEDYTRSMGTNRSKEGEELLFARTYLPVIAAEAGITAIDTVWSDLADEEGFRKEIELAKKIGFTGKSCIHPKQIKTVHKYFAPLMEEIVHAKKIVELAREAEKEGQGVFTVDGKMVDEPVIQKAKRTLIMAGENQ